MTLRLRPLLLAALFCSGTALASESSDPPSTAAPADRPMRAGELAGGESATPSPADVLPQPADEASDEQASDEQAPADRSSPEGSTVDDSTVDDPTVEPADADDSTADDPTVEPTDADDSTVDDPTVEPADADDPAPDAAPVDDSSLDSSTAADTGLPIDPDAPAVEPATDAEAPTEEGVWTWVARMEGEIPDPEMVEAAEERFEEELAESALIDDLGGVDVPRGYYADPASELAGDPLYLDLVDADEFDIPVVVNDQVEKWVRYFAGDGARYYRRWMARSSRYRPMMYAMLEEAGLPRDLVYLSMIESGYNAHAYSHAHAVGLWQFIPSTGRLYDLRVDWWVDERRDPEKSTAAAVAFLGELHEMFGSWELAWAAYNGGPGRVRRAIRSSGTEDFWTIAQGAWLASETENYVPKIMAAAIVGKHPERYGFDESEIEFKPEFAYDTATVEGMVEVSLLAEIAGLDERTFKFFNPHLRRWATPEGTTTVRVPQGSRDAFVAKLDEVPSQERLSFVRHKVRRGETLSVIAGRYGVTVRDMVRVNKLRNANRIFVGMMLVVPTGGARQVADSAAVRATDAVSDKQVPERRPTRHTVRRGDTLSAIAARYGLSVSDLQRWNDLSGSTIHVGQELSLDGAAGTRTVRYQVQRGDNLTRIATRHGVGVGAVQRWNNLRDPSRIYVGQTLTLHVDGGSGWTSYTVRPGDSLGAIGSRHGVTVSELRAWNDLSGSVIHPGQELRIRQ